MWLRSLCPQKAGLAHTRNADCPIARHHFSRLTFLLYGTAILLFLLSYADLTYATLRTSLHKDAAEVTLAAESKTFP